MDRKLLVLDLDYTLVYPSDREISDADFTITVGETYWIKKRPYLEQFLVEAAQYYDLAVWSASDAAYVHAILARIIPAHIKLVFVYCGDRCTIKRDTFMNWHIIIKDLKKVWRRKRWPYRRHNTLIVDDTPSTYIRNRGNAISIAAYNGDTDVELTRISQLLTEYKDLLNVRYKKEIPL